MSNVKDLSRCLPSILPVSSASVKKRTGISDYGDGDSPAGLLRNDDGGATSDFKESSTSLRRVALGAGAAIVGRGVGSIDGGTSSSLVFSRTGLPPRSSSSVEGEPLRLGATVSVRLLVCL